MWNRQCLRSSPKHGWGDFQQKGKPCGAGIGKRRGWGPWITARSPSDSIWGDDLVPAGGGVRRRWCDVCTVVIRISDSDVMGMRSHKQQTEGRERGAEEREVWHRRTLNNKTREETLRLSRKVPWATPVIHYANGSTVLALKCSQLSLEEML